MAMHMECMYDGAGAQCNAMEKSASQDRAQLHSLNERLASYVSRVRHMRQNTLSSSDNHAEYHQAMSALEDEIVKVKGLYEAEVQRLRRLLDDATRTNVSLTSKLAQASVISLQNKTSYEDESVRTRTLSDELDRTRLSLAQVQKELADTRICLQASDSELKELHPTTGRLRQENDEIKLRLESERNRGLQAQEELRLIRDRVGFEDVARTQEMQDLEERLKASQEIILGLETKLSQLTERDNLDVNSLLKRLRESSSTELRRYQQESENALNISLDVFRKQVEGEIRAKDVIEKEKADLENKVYNLNATIDDLEGKLTVMKQQRRTAESALAAERSRYQGVVEDLERRVRDLQASLVCKVKQCSSARDAQMALKVEIDAFKSLLDTEEQQLSTVQSSSSSVSVSALNMEAARRSVMKPRPRSVTNYKPLPITNCSPSQRYHVNSYTTAYETAQGYEMHNYQQLPKVNTNSSRLSMTFPRYQSSITGQKVCRY